MKPVKFKKMVSEFIVESVTSRRKALVELTKILREYDIDFVVIGGAILPEYGYVRNTEDVDLLVDRADKGKLDNIPPAVMRQKTGITWIMHSPKCIVQTLFSGDKMGETASVKYPKPNTVAVSLDIEGCSVPVLNLAKLIEFKLTSGLYGLMRSQDFVDVQQLLIHNRLKRDFARKHEFGSDTEKKYEELWNEYSSAKHKMTEH